MTSACGVVEEVHTEETGIYEGRVDRNVRAAIKGQKAVIVPFAAGNVTRDFVESVEKKLSIDGRHTYLYELDADEIADEIRKESVYDAAQVHDGNYI